MTVSRCRISSATTSATTRRTARTTRTAITTTCPGTPASRARPTIPRSSRCGARQKRNLLASLLLLARCADAAHGRRALAHAGRQQQRLLLRTTRSAGWIGRDARADPELLGFVQALIGLRRRYDAFRRRDFLTRASRAAQRPQGRLLARARGPRDDRRRLGRRPAPHPRHAARQRCARRSALPHPAQRGAGPGRVPSRAGCRATAGSRCSTRASRAASSAARPRRSTPAERFPSMPVRSCSSSTHRQPPGPDAAFHAMPFGAEVAEDGVRFALWAPTAREVALVLGEKPHAMPAAECRLASADRAEGSGRRPLPLPHRRRPHGAGPGLALPARRRARAEPRRRSARLRLVGRCLDRTAVGRGGDLRGPCRHGDAGGHLRRARREARGARATSA